MSLSASAPHPDDTIVAVSSAPGPGARAIVRISGLNTCSVVARVFQASGGRQPPVHSTHPDPLSNRRLTPPTRHLVPGSLTLSGVHSSLPATLYFCRGPRSYTGQDVAELHTVGSPPLVERLVADLHQAGARPALPGEFTLRAFLAGKKDLPQAEAVNAVIEAGTDADLASALSQLAGGVTRPLHALRDDLLNLLADLEAALDFADEEIEFVGKSETLLQLDAALAQFAALARQLEDRTVSGRPVRIAIVGRPNAGKSALFNALAGGEAIVSPIPGTTRDYLTKRFDLAGISVELADTAGWQDSADTIEEQAQRLGGEQATRADVILWCDEHAEFAASDAARLAATGASVMRVRTKSDVSRDPKGCAISVSVVSPGGTDSLSAALADCVVSLARPALAPSQSRCRHHVAACTEHLGAARDHVAGNEPEELAAAALRAALEHLAEMTGAIFTNDLLDRIFSRFCIGK